MTTRHCERLDRSLQRHRSPEQMTLPFVAFVPDEKLALIGRLYALRDNVDSQTLGHRNDRKHDGDIVFLMRKAANEDPINL